jgi:hypothetical protein
MLASPKDVGIENNASGISRTYKECEATLKVVEKEQWGTQGNSLPQSSLVFLLA